MENSKYRVAGPTVQRKLEQSMLLASTMQLRSIRCPICGFYLLDVYGHDHYLVRVKCRKCKFDQTIDTALFRTLQRKLRSQINNTNDF